MRLLTLSLLLLAGCASTTPSTLEQAGTDAGAGAIAGAAQPPLPPAPQKPKGGGGPGSDDK